MVSAVCKTAIQSNQHIHIMNKSLINDSTYSPEYLVTELLRASRVGDTKKAKEVIETMNVNGFKKLINHQNDKGNSSLHRAAKYGHPDIVKLLLENGADPLSTNDLGKTPLTYAIKTGIGSSVELLKQSLGLNFKSIERTKVRSNNQVSM